QLVPVVLLNRFCGPLLLGAVNLEIPASTAAHGGNRQNEQDRTHIAVCVLGLLRLGIVHRLGVLHRLGLHAHALGHVGGAYGAIGVDGPGHALIRTGTGGDFHPGGFHSSQQIGLVHNAEKVCFVLFAVLV